MITVEGKNPFYEVALAEHRELRHMLQHIADLFREAVAAPSRDLTARLLEELEALEKHLSLHFRSEEQGGYLEEAVTRLPRLGLLVDSLENEHRPLERQLLELIACVRSERPNALALREMFARFRKNLLAHEAAEDQVLDEAFSAFQVH